MPSLGTTARQHSRPGLGLHTRAEAVRLGAMAAVRLEGTLGHRTVLIRESLPYGQVLSIADPVQIRQSPVMVPLLQAADTLLCRHLRLPFAHACASSSHRIDFSSRIFIFPGNTSSHASRLSRHLVVNSPQNLSVRRRALRVFTSGGAIFFFGDNAAHSMLLSVLVSAPFTTEFSGVTPNLGSDKRLRTDSPSPGAILVEEPKKRNRYTCRASCREARCCFFSLVYRRPNGKRAS